MMKNQNVLINRVGNYLLQTLGEDLLSEGAWEGTVNLPRYILQTYEIRKAKLSNNQVLLITNKEGTQALSALIKQRALIERVAGIPVIWIGESIQGYVRKEMIAQRAPFIIPFKQAYLPLLGIQFQERELARRPETQDKLQVATQVFVINVLLNNLPNKLNAKELALSMGYSLMTMTRIKNELLEHSWLDREVYQKDGLLQLGIKDIALWEATKPYMQNPIRKRLWIRSPTQSIGELPLAGLSALTIQTLLGEPANVVRAVGESDWRKLEKELDANQVLPEQIDGALELEIWRYAPQRVKISNAQEWDQVHSFIDPYSLCLSLEQIDDDRVKLSLKELMTGVV